jgi:two-component system response regulator HydG
MATDALLSANKEAWERKMIRILVVEDRAKARAQLAEVARTSDAEVVTADSKEQAIQAIAGETFDVVITDLKLGEKDLGAGLEVLKAAKEKDRYTQVIVITSYGTPQISVTAMGLGAFDYLEKNAPGTDIFSMIKRKVALALDYRNAKLKESSVR